MLCSMRHEGEGPGDAVLYMQHAGGCLIHILYPLTFSFATRPFSAFAWRGLVVKQCAMPGFISEFRSRGGGGGQMLSKGGGGGRA